jgi:rifampin ADP-ribosylating transferase
MTKRVERFTRFLLLVGLTRIAGFRSNYRPEVVMNHIYFTEKRDGAGLAAEIISGQGAPRVYEIEPTGPFEDDPNVTDKKFAGNPTRSFRSASPLRVVAEVHDWTRLTPEELATWDLRLKRLREDPTAQIVN